MLGAPAPDGPSAVLLDPRRLGKPPAEDSDRLLHDGRAGIDVLARGLDRDKRLDGIDHGRQQCLGAGNEVDLRHGCSSLATVA